jgi:hypothetical protein
MLLPTIIGSTLLAGGILHTMDDKTVKTRNNKFFKLLISLNIPQEKF